MKKMMILPLECHLISTDDPPHFLHGSFIPIHTQRSNSELVVEVRDVVGPADVHADERDLIMWKCGESPEIGLGHSFHAECMQMKGRRSFLWGNCTDYWMNVLYLLRLELQISNDGRLVIMEMCVVGHARKVDVNSLVFREAKFIPFQNFSRLNAYKFLGSEFGPRYGLESG